MTQSELADEFGYSDKAISKWENGDTLPDIETLYKLCQFYNVSLDFLVDENSFENKIQYVNRMNKTIVINNALIETLYCSFVWILAGIIYTYLFFISNINFWQIFVWSLPATSLVLLATS